MMMMMMMMMRRRRIWRTSWLLWQTHTQLYRCVCLCSVLKEPTRSRGWTSGWTRARTSRSWRSGSSSPIDFPQEQWLVGNDIENIERYRAWVCLFKINCLNSWWNEILRTAAESLLIPRPHRDMREMRKPPQQTQGHDATATEKPR